MKLHLLLVVLIISNNISLNALIKESSKDDNSKLETVYIDSDDDSNNLEKQLPYPMEHGRLKEPKCLSKLLTQVGLINYNNLSDDLKVAQQFLGNAASDKNTIVCIVYVLLYTDLKEQLHKRNKLSAALIHMVKSCIESTTKNSENHYLQDNYAVCENVMSMLLPLAPFFNGSEFIYEYVLPQLCCSVEICAYAHPEDVIKMFLVSLLAQNHTVINLFCYTKLFDFTGDQLFFKLIKDDFINLLKYTCKLNNLTFFQLLLWVGKVQCEIVNKGFFESSSIKLTSDEIKNIIESEEIPQDVQNFINNYLNE